jgi:anti-sigma B factor antagonist
MAIVVTCPNGHSLRVKNEFAGKSGLCPHCRARVRVPNPAQAFEEEIATILGAPKVYSRSPIPSDDEESIHQAAPQNDAREQSGISLLGSSFLRRKKVCPRCCNITSVTFTTCPRCGTPLPVSSVELSEEQVRQASQATQDLDLQRHGDVIVVHFGKQRLLDQSAVETTSNGLYSVAGRADCRNYLLNFANIVGLSGSMLEKLLLLKQKVESKGGKLKLCQVGPEIREVFTATRLGQGFDIWDKEEDALKAFAAIPSTTSGNW